MFIKGKVCDDDGNDLNQDGDYLNTMVANLNQEENDNLNQIGEKQKQKICYLTISCSLLICNFDKC